MTDTQPDALRLADWVESVVGGPHAKQCAAELRRQYAEIETLRTGYASARLEIESLRAAQPAGAQQPGAAYAALPTHSHAGRVYEEGFLIGTCPLYTADKMRAFADATHALRASHGQAPAGESLRTDALCDLSYSHGLKTGWNYCASDDLAGFERAQKIGTEALCTLKSTTAQADPLQPVVALQEIAGMYADDFKPQADRQPAPTAVAGPREVVKFTDQSTADPVEKARRYLTAMGSNHLHSSYFFDDGYPKQESATDALATLAVMEHLAAAPTTQPAPQQEPSHTSVQLAEMVLSDCGHSSNYTPLLERVAVRIDAHVERRLDELRGCLESRPLPAAQEGRERDMPIGALLPCPCCGGKTTEYDRFNANRVSCNSCGLSVRQSEQGAGDAAQHWNRRAPQPSPAAQGDALDAARYRWLRRWKGQEHEPPFTVQHEIDGTLWGGDLDAAVDAARKQGAQHDPR